MAASHQQRHHHQQHTHHKRPKRRQPSQPQQPQQQPQSHEQQEPSLQHDEPMPFLQPPPQIMAASIPPRYAITIRPDHLDELRMRMAYIEEQQQAAEAARAQIVRAETLTRLLSEALTAWLAQEYGMDVQYSQWHIDLERMALVRVDTPPSSTHARVNETPETLETEQVIDGDDI